MKERNTEKKTMTGKITVGLDLGDKTSAFCILDSNGEIECEGTVATTGEKIRSWASRLPACVIALEAGAHSMWVSHLLTEVGHQAIVADVRKVRYISASTNKCDRADAEALARLARADIKLLHPIEHRSAVAQLHLTSIRVRALLVTTRTKLINGARGLCKCNGERLPSCEPSYVTASLADQLSSSLRDAILPLLEQVEALNRQIREVDKQLEAIASEHYPETKLLRQVHGVGPVIALSFVLTIDRPQRFAKSREAGCYLGLKPKRRNSSKTDPQLGISKTGNSYMRSLLINAAQTILRRKSPDSDLKRWGLKLAGETNDKRLKKRAVVAVARKLSILLHALWRTGEVYEPLRNNKSNAKAA